MPIGKISTDTTHCAVPRRLLSFLSSVPKSRFQRFYSFDDILRFPTSFTFFCEAILDVFHILATQPHYDVYTSCLYVRAPIKSFPGWARVGNWANLEREPTTMVWGGAPRGIQENSPLKLKVFLRLKEDPVCLRPCITGNKSVPKIILNDTINLFF